MSHALNRRAVLGGALVLPVCFPAAAFAQAADIVLHEAKGFGGNTFKIELARRTIIRALSQAARATPQSQSSKKIA